MNAQVVVFGIVTFLHDLFTAIWIGGLIAMDFTMLPAAKQVLGTGPQTRKLTAEIQKRQSVLVYISILSLILTGLLQARRAPSFEELYSAGNVYSGLLSLKHILVLGMILITLYRNLVLGRTKGPLTPTKEKLNGLLLILNITLGILVLLMSGFMVSLSAGPPGV